MIWCRQHHVSVNQKCSRLIRISRRHWRESKYTPAWIQHRAIASVRLSKLQSLLNVRKATRNHSQKWNTMMATSKHCGQLGWPGIRNQNKYKKKCIKSSTRYSTDLRVEQGPRLMHALPVQCMEVRKFHSLWQKQIRGQSHAGRLESLRGASVLLFQVLRLGFEAGQIHSLGEPAHILASNQLKIQSWRSTRYAVCWMSSRWCTKELERGMVRRCMHCIEGIRFIASGAWIGRATAKQKSVCFIAVVAIWACIHPSIRCRNTEIYSQAAATRKRRRISIPIVATVCDWRPPL